MADSKTVNLKFHLIQIFAKSLSLSYLFRVKMHSSFEHDQFEVPFDQGHLKP